AALQILAVPRSLPVDNIVYPPRISAETIRLPAELLQEEARAASRPRNHTRTITSPPPFRSIPRAWFGSRLQPFSQLSISDQTSSVSGKQIDEGGNRSTPITVCKVRWRLRSVISRGTKMRLQTGGLVPRRVTLMAYTSTRVSGCLKRPCPPPRIWRKNGSTSACPSATRPTLPPRVAFRTRVSQTPASVANTDSR